MKRLGASPAAKSISSPHIVVLKHHSPLEETKGLLREMTDSRSKGGNMPDESRIWLYSKEQGSYQSMTQDST